MTGAPGVGIDLLAVGRLERALQRRPQLAGRLFTERELAFCTAKARPARHLAGRFCAKEAAIKALGLGPGAIRCLEIEGGGDGPPSLLLSGPARQRAESLGVTVEISITHDREMAAAVAIARSR